jgi:hypothetical protein
VRSVRPAPPLACPMPSAHRSQARMSLIRCTWFPSTSLCDGVRWTRGEERSLGVAGRRMSPNRTAKSRSRVSNWKIGPRCHVPRAWSRPSPTCLSQEGIRERRTNGHWTLVQYGRRTGSRLTPKGLSKSLGGGDEPPRQAVFSGAAMGRGRAVAGRHTLVKRRVRRPALPRQWVGAIVIGTTTAGEATLRPVEALRASARQPTPRRLGAGWHRTGRPLAGHLTKTRSTSDQSAKEAQQRNGSSFHGIPSSNRCRTHGPGGGFRGVNTNSGTAEPSSAMASAWPGCSARRSCQPPPRAR